VQGNSNNLYYDNTTGKMYYWNGTAYIPWGVESQGSILSANACVGSVVNIPNGNPNDIRTVGTGGDFADLQTALADSSVVNETILKVISNLTTSTTINVNKAVVIDGNGFKLESATNNPVNILPISSVCGSTTLLKIRTIYPTISRLVTCISIIISRVSVKIVCKRKRIFKITIRVYWSIIFIIHINIITKNNQINFHFLEKRLCHYLNLFN
jgi:hypothetical protein